MASKPTAEAELIGLVRAAQRLGVNPKTLRKAINRGDLTFVRLGTLPKAPIYFRQADLDAYIRPGVPGTVSEG